jgi:hypothetical protein
MNKAIHRSVRQFEIQNESQQNYSIGQFSSYLKYTNIILLGDPGSGKTHTFKLSAQEENAKFLTVRQFLALSEESYQGETLYLDGLDEFRSRVDDKNSIIEIIRLLDKMGQPRLRLSCRVADWLGETDLSLFRAYFRKSPYVVLGLEPLTDEEVNLILSEGRIGGAEEFIRQAENRGLEDLLRNPQTLIMLTDIVEQDSWPITKCELFNKSIEKLLSEHNLARMDGPLGQYNYQELVGPAGAVCATILISGVTAISLLPSQVRDDVPSHRSLSFHDSNSVLACLGRRAFSFVEENAVSYIHRTIAEFLAAKWLVTQIRNGLPIRRVQSLIGIEGHPASELRGLHAWLATLLQEHATILIKNDPYGVLMYGDPAFLSLSDRQLLINELESLSQTDPWFRASNWSDHPLGALSGRDMVESFRRILSDSKSTYHLRSIVMDAIRNGPSLPEMRDDMMNILSNSEAEYHDRKDAVDALLVMAPDCKDEITKIYGSILAADPSSVELRAYILSKIYAEQFQPSDVVLIFNDVINNNKEVNIIGRFWDLVHSLPEDALPDILDGLCGLKYIKKNQRNNFDIEYFFSRTLSRLLGKNIPLTAERLWKWMEALCRFGYLPEAHGKNDIRDWFMQNQQIVLVMFEYAYQEHDIKKFGWHFLYEFKKVILNSISDDILARHAFDILKNKKVITDKECLLYEIIGLIVFLSDTFQNSFLEEVFDFADKDEQLKKIRTDLCQRKIEDWRFENNKKKLKHERDREKARKQNMANLEKTKDLIRSGRHLNNIGFLAQIYYGFFIDVDKNLSPIDRLRDKIGNEHLISALEGFNAVIRRTDLPTPTEIAEYKIKGSYFTWWYAILAGIDEGWAQERKIDIFPDNLLKSALAIALEHTTYEYKGKDRYKTQREWIDSIVDQRPDLIQSTYEEMARIVLKDKNSSSDIIHLLTNSNYTKPWRADLSLKLLYDCPPLNSNKLLLLINAAISNPACHKKLRTLSIVTINTIACMEREVGAIWRVVRFLLSNGDFLRKFIDYARCREWTHWILIEMINMTHDKIELSINQLEAAITIVGYKHKNIYPPSGSWTGSWNPWDFAEPVRKWIDALSAISELNAAIALKHLLDNKSLSTYHNHLRHAIASQAIIRREAKYKQPTWPETIETLRGGRPSNVKDLHALVLNHLETLKVEIRLSNTDTYKIFWRCNSFAAIDHPEVEDICRDRLIELMKYPLLPLGLRIEPEGHMVTDKRADIVVLPPPGQKLPIEVKRDTHPDLWDACKNQLERLYTRDPEAEGYGIYVVFWFGNRRSGQMPAAPEGIERPESAADLEKGLQLLIPSDKRHCLEAIVIDVTVPV